jgi:hypothetical protein
MSTDAHVHVFVGINAKDWASFKVVPGKATRYNEKSGEPYEIDVQNTIFTVGDREFSFEGGRVGYEALLKEMGLEDDYVEKMEFGHLGYGKLGVKVVTVSTYDPEAELDPLSVIQATAIAREGLAKLGIQAEPRILVSLEWY